MRATRRHWTRKCWAWKQQLDSIGNKGQLPLNSKPAQIVLNNIKVRKKKCAETYKNRVQNFHRIFLRIIRQKYFFHKEKIQGQSRHRNSCAPPNINSSLMLFCNIVFEPTGAYFVLKLRNTRTEKKPFSKIALEQFFWNLFFEQFDCRAKVDFFLLSKLEIFKFCPFF